MKTTRLTGFVKKDFLVFYRMQPHVHVKELPPAFKPALLNNTAVGCIRIIEINGLRKAAFPAFAGMSVINMINLLAVEWEQESQAQKGWYALQSFSSAASRQKMTGSALFTRTIAKANFNFLESNGGYFISAEENGRPAFSLSARHADKFAGSTLFSGIAEVQGFMEKSKIFASSQGQELSEEPQGHLQPLEVFGHYSAFFDNEKLFPEGKAVLDSAFLAQERMMQWQRQRP